MTSSELKYLYEQNDGGYFFTRSTMKFFGDTMSNYGVRNARVIQKWDDNVKPFDALELYRRHPVRNGLDSSAYFSTSGKQLSAVKSI